MEPVHAYRDHRSEGPGALSDRRDAKDPSRPSTTLQKMRAVFRQRVHVAGRILVAGMLVVSAPEHATEELTYVVDHAKDPEAMVARLRLARVLAYREKYDDALKR